VLKEGIHPQAELTLETTLPAHEPVKYGFTKLTSVTTVLVNSPQNLRDSSKRPAGEVDLNARRQLSALQPQTPDGRLKLFFRERWSFGSVEREASAPRPRLAKPFQRRQEFLPPVRALSASMMASRAWMKVGRQGWLGLTVVSCGSWRMGVLGRRGDIQLHSVEDKLESEETSIGGNSLAVERW